MICGWEPGLDNIVLGAGNDTFSGGGGGDTVQGGLGADRLTGGAGADRFVFVSTDQSTSAAAGRDTIADFDGTADVIDLSGIDAIAGGVNDTFAFVGAAGFTGLGQVRAVASGGNTLVQVNTTGGLGADMQILLSGAHVLTLDDFAL